MPRRRGTSSTILFCFLMYDMLSVGYCDFSIPLLKALINYTLITKARVRRILFSQSGKMPHR